MTVMTLNQLKSLMEKKDTPCISIYVPCFQAVNRNHHDQICLKSLLKEAEQQLKLLGYTQEQRERLLQPAHELMQDTFFWQTKQRGLVLLLADHFFESLWTPFPVPPLVVINRHFHFKPLVPGLTAKTAFYLLTLSQEQVRLFKGDETGLVPIPLLNVPQNLAEALRFNAVERQQRMHSSASRFGTSMTFGGHGSQPETAKNNVLEFFQAIDRAVSAELRGHKEPLLIAGVNYIQSIYREANHYASLLEQGLNGHFDHWETGQLHELVWPMMSPILDKDQATAQSLYRYFANTSRTSHDLRTIVAATVKGQVHTLFVNLEEQAWGSYDPASSSCDLHEAKAGEDQDLVELAALQTLLHHGRVYALTEKQVPDQAKLAAIFRYV